MERVSKVVEAAKRVDMVAEGGLVGPSLKDFSAVETAISAEKELANILETFDFLTLEARRSMLEALLTEAEENWKIDPVYGNKDRFIAEAVAKKLHEDTALAEYLDAVDLPADTKISFH